MSTKKEQILSVAYHLMAEGNYQSMTTSKIAQAAGVAEGTLYRYFTNKRHLLMEVMGYYSNTLMDKIFGKVDNEKTIYENLKRFADTFHESLHNDLVFYRIMLKVFSELDSKELCLIIQDYYTRYLNRIKDVFIWAKNKGEVNLPDNEIDLLVKTLWGMGEGIIKRSILYNGEPVPKDEMNYALRLVEIALAGGIL